MDNAQSVSDQEELLLLRHLTDRLESVRTFIGRGENIKAIHRFTEIHKAMQKATANKMRCLPGETIIKEESLQVFKQKERLAHEQEQTIRDLKILAGIDGNSNTLAALKLKWTAMRLDLLDQECQKDREENRHMNPERISRLITTATDFDSQAFRDFCKQHAEDQYVTIPE